MSPVALHAYVMRITASASFHWAIVSQPIAFSLSATITRKNYNT